MNKEKMIEHIATEVMWWKNDPHSVDFTVSEGRVYSWVLDEEFDPFSNHQQAFDALDTLRKQGTEIIITAGLVDECGVYNLSGELLAFATCDPGNLLTAICTAICRATGYEG